MIYNLQALRFFAAIMVVALHILTFGSSKYGLDAVALTSQLHGLAAGVDVFFVISGFIMVYIGSGNTSTSTSRFLVKRFKRIYPIYWFISLLVLPIFIFFPEMVNAGACEPTSIWKSFLLFPQAGVPLLMVAWTLEFEVFFYVIFSAFLAFKPITQVSIISSIFSISVFSGMFWGLNEGRGAFIDLIVSPLLFEFVVGMWIAILYRFARSWMHAMSTRLIISGLWALSLIVLILVPEGALPRVVHYGAFAALTVFLVLAAPDFVSPTLRKLSHDLADASYPLYLVHVLVISAVGRILTHFDLLPYSSFLFVFFSLFLSVSVSVVLSDPLRPIRWLKSRSPFIQAS